MRTGKGRKVGVDSGDGEGNRVGGDETVWGRG